MFVFPLWIILNVYFRINKLNIQQSRKIKVFDFFSIHPNTDCNRKDYLVSPKRNWNLFVAGPAQSSMVDILPNIAHLKTTKKYALSRPKRESVLQSKRPVMAIQTNLTSISSQSIASMSTKK